MLRQLLRLSFFIAFLLPVSLMAQSGCINPIYPLDMEVDVPLDLLVEWEAPTSGDPVIMYHFMWGTSPTGLISLGSTTNTNYSVTQFSLETTYYWRVDTESASGINTSCQVYSYTTLGLPDAPMINCGGATVDYVSDLESYPDGWTGDVGDATLTNLWNFRTGQTPSPNTGPEGAYAGNQYVYYESSFANADASMVSPAIDLSTAVGDVALTFYLHAFGANMNRLEVGVGLSATGPFTTEWSWDGSLQSNMADPWELVGLDISSYAGQTVYLEFKNVFQGGTASGDIAIDQIEVHGCEANVPENNVCSGAMELSAGGEPGMLVDQNTGEASDSGIGLPSCSTTAGNDLFYTVQTDIDGGELFIDITSGVSSKMTLVLYDNTCGSLTEMACATAATVGADVQLAYYVNGAQQGGGSSASRMVPQDFVVRVYDENNAAENFTIETSGSSQAALPVELIEWKAVLQATSVRLDWSTASEINSDQFVVEKSRDGRTWNEISVVPAMGYSYEQVQYAYSDYELYALQYYRLRMIDIDGSATVSSIITIKRDDLNINVYPNPASEELRLASFDFASEIIEIQVIGLDGRQVKNLQINTNSDVLLDISDLSAGYYQIAIMDGQAVYNSSFVKQ